MSILLAVLGLLGVTKEVFCDQLVNVALDMTPTQSGTLNWPTTGGVHLWNVSNSVDGRTDCVSNETYKYLQYSGTNNSWNPWWQLDLGSVYDIQAIHVIGRPKISPRQLVGFKVSVGSTENDVSMIYRNTDNTYGNGSIWINNTITARYIRISVDNTTYRAEKAPLVLCEVEVYAQASPIKVEGQTDMSSVYQSNETVYGSDRAIDGKDMDSTGNIDTCQCCSVTKGTENPWWRIDFGKQLLIGGVNITGRSGGNEDQSTNIDIFISNILPQGDNGELVSSVPSTASGSFFPHPFVPPRLFRYLTIMRPGVSEGQARFLTICEVDFSPTECELGRFGDRCSRLCHCGDMKPCSPVTGNCQTSGCMQGSEGDACECQQGLYGQNCIETCGHCAGGNKTCLTNDGRCPGGCMPGYDPSNFTCKTECQQGLYGQNCTETCGQCAGGNKTCSPNDGRCPGGCMPGYDSSNVTCKTECHPGYYGQNCSKQCGHCGGSINMCSPKDGRCPGGCRPGYNSSDITCKTECQQGLYGQNCIETCGHCAGGNKTCLPNDGRCPGGCMPGYDPSNFTCKTECQQGLYGQNCTETCGQCAGGNKTCSPNDGRCPGGCMPGYDSSNVTCKTECQHGHYGQNCSKECGHCGGVNITCSPSDGKCPRGCMPGYDPLNTTCSKECPPGSYGQDCNYTCGQCIGGSSCRLTDGTCTGGCAPGYNVSDGTCKTKCEPGRYGQNCNGTCGHCLGGPSMCSVFDGTCQNGCEAGFEYGTDVKCKIECTPGQYGMECNETCGHCFDGNDTCSSSNGTCTVGCAPGVIASDPTCETECQPGHFGYNCNETCGQCMNGRTSCSVIDGRCHYGCAQGYKASGPTCQIECDRGKYGYDCNETCGYCIDGTSACSFTDGKCEGGCAPGYMPSDLTCKTECTNGSYGQSCSKTCGNCDHGCSKVNGTCIDRQCKDGYTGETCMEALPPTSQSQTGPIAGGISGTIVIVIIVVVIVILVKRRGGLSKGGGQNKRKDTDRETSFTNMYENVTRDKTDRQTGESETVSKQEEPEEAGGENYYSFDALQQMTGVIKVHDLWTYIFNSKANNWEELFEGFEKLPGGLQHPCKAARSDDAVYKNKYRNMYPYDKNRVKLIVPEGESDYINASHVDGYERVGKFIAAQGPQPGTVADFWHMVWQQNTRKIVMLTNVMEMGKDKCEQYWPKGEGGEQYGDFHVTIKDTIEKLDFTIRTLELRHGTDKSRRVDQFHFQSWPDKDVPDSTWCLVRFWRKAMERDTKKGPIVVHCSAGIGRTGTFIALDALYRQAQAEGGIRPATMIETLRRQRVNMVQTRFQYAYLHEAIAEALLIGTHFYWASQLPALHAYMTDQDPVVGRPRFETQYELICKSLPQTPNSPAEEAVANDYEIGAVAEPKYGNITEMSEYRPRSKNRYSASIQQMKALFLPNYADACTYIITEAPTEACLRAFWAMVEEQNITTIINFTEESKLNYETSCMLGTNNGGIVGQFDIKCKTETKQHSYVVRSFMYKKAKTDEQDRVNVKAFTLNNWKAGYPYPGDLDPLLELLEEVTKWHPYVSEAKPVLLMCGDGRIRSGLVAAIFNESQRMRNDDGHVNIVETIMTMKKRVGQVITCEQMKFLYDAVFMYARRTGYVPENTVYNNTQ